MVIWGLDDRLTTLTVRCGLTEDFHFTDFYYCNFELWNPHEVVTAFTTSQEGYKFELSLLCELYNYFTFGSSYERRELRNPEDLLLYNYVPRYHLLYDLECSTTNTNGIYFGIY